MSRKSPRVFVSYSHDSNEHVKRVLALSDRLRRAGVDCEADKYEQFPEDGWPRWMLRQIREAESVLVICTQKYCERFEGRAPDGEGKGTKWESTVITRELYESEGKNSKFIPVLLSESGIQHIPDLLKDATRFVLGSDDGYERLYRFLTKQPEVLRPKLGSVRSLPPREQRERHEDFRTGSRPAGLPNARGSRKADTFKEALAAWAGESYARADALTTDLMAKTGRSPYASGTWSVAYLVDGTFDRPNPAALMDILRRIEGSESTWPPWAVLGSPDARLYLNDGLVECWDQARTDDMADFWRASPDAKLYLLRSHQEDTGMAEKAKSVLDLTLPVWHVGECLLHAGRLAAALGVPSAAVHMSCRWTGLGGRVLKALANPHRHLRRRVSVQDVVSSNVSVCASDIDAQLPELTRSLTEPLYQTFDFHTPSPEMYREELARMRGRGS